EGSVMDHLTSGQHSQLGLTEIPYDTILTQTDTLEVLDLSYNLLEEYPSLNSLNLEKLSTLILDCNNYTSHIKFPYMPSVTALCINKNKINNLHMFVEEIRRKFPNIKILSMMNNEAAPSCFNGGTTCVSISFCLVRQYVISQIPGLEILDDTEVLEKERAQARKTYRLQQSSHSSRTRKDMPKKHTQKKSNTVRRT
uniref:U2A'/phosphoprotein 32 family A C-terminal domain-containing protein n=1 Tax=Sparus aurata TaxID=8175 RepID=A0A671UF65_SPAAU